jgi:chromosome segregation ATPase
MSTTSPNLPPPPSQEKSMIPEGVKLGAILILLLGVIYLFYDNYSSGQAAQKQFRELSEKIKRLEMGDQVAEAAFRSQVSKLQKDIAGTQDQVVNTQTSFKKTTSQISQIQAEGQKTKSEFSQALASKADTSLVDAQVQAAKTDAANKIGQVNTEVGGVKTQVAAVKTDLEATRRDLEGTQRQLVDVNERLSTAVAKNAAELTQLRLKGERDYDEFKLPKKNISVKVEDIRLILTKTDSKKGRFNLKIIVDDKQLEKKDRLINEPIQFLVGHNRIRYEVVINTVEKDSAEGYLSIPKDKALSAEHPKQK